MNQKKSSYCPLELKGILLLSFSIMVSLSLLSFHDGDASRNNLGLLGHILAFSMQYLLGLGSYLLVAALAGLSWRYLCAERPDNFQSSALSFLLFLFSFCLLLNIVAELRPQFAEGFGSFVYSEAVSIEDKVPYRIVRYHLGGVPIYYLYRDLPLLNFKYFLGDLGSLILALTGLLIASLRISNASLRSMAYSVLVDCTAFFRFSFFKWLSGSLSSLFKKAWQKKKNDYLLDDTFLEDDTPLEQEPIKQAPLSRSPSLNVSKNNEASFPKLEESTVKQMKSQDPEPQAQIRANFEMPSSSILHAAKRIDQSALKKQLSRQAVILEETLLSFGIEGKVNEINCGPTITSFELQPAIGVKVQKIKSLEDDIALNLQAKSIRIVAPIPGKAVVGIEVPSPCPQEVGFREMLQHYQTAKKKLNIPVILGKSVLGEQITYDLSKMPHCIIAGATGSGKSVCINTIVMSILMNMKPEQIKLLMIDPKKVELTPYSKLPHMLAPVITEPAQATAALNWLVKEMEFRYEILKQLGQRNITSFNQRKVDSAFEASLSIEIPEKLPYIVGIIDELADLMMISSSDIETPIARIAQMARAVGIHLIIATQRPSREVITGLIKANFPSRIAFKVASRVNSQIILDEVGAESLLGNGDMLFRPPDSSNLIRAQGAYVRDEDIQKIVQKICEQAPPNYWIKSFDESPESSQEKNFKADSLFDEAKKIVIETGNASTTFLQRKLKIGYARAASLMDQLESSGIVSKPEGSRPRKILAKPEADF